VRLFFAVELPAEVQAALGRLRAPEGRAYRWVEPAQLHVTLVFLGEQPGERLGVLEQAGATAAGAVAPGVLKLGEAGYFGSRKTPGVLWIGLDGDVTALLSLQARLTTALRTAGVSLQDDRPFKPHITLARRRPAAQPGPPPDWPPSPDPLGHAFALQALTLFESRLSPRGATYHRLLHAPLGAPPAG